MDRLDRQRHRRGGAPALGAGTTHRSTARNRRSRGLRDTAPVELYAARLREGGDADPCVHRRGRRLSGKPGTPLSRGVCRLAARAVPPPAGAQPRAVWRLSRFRRTRDREHFARALPATRRRDAARGSAPDQRNASARRDARPRRRVGTRARHERKGPRGKCDDRRSAAKRFGQGLLHRLGDGHGAARSGVAPDGASSRLDGHRHVGESGRCIRPAARRLSGRVDHRRAEDSRHGDHRGAGARAARRVLRRDRLHLSRRRNGYEYSDPHDRAADAECREHAVEYILRRNHAD